MWWSAAVCVCVWPEALCRCWPRAWLQGDVIYHPNPCVMNGGEHTGLINNAVSAAIMMKH